MHESLPQALIVLWLNFIISAVPLRLIGTFVELLIGAMISGSGHITDALFQVGHQKHFSTYYWLLNRGKWSSFNLIQQLVRLIITVFARKEWNFILDDFICPRSSQKAPHAKYHHEHSQKPNRPQYIWGQQWLGLSVSLSWDRLCACLPILLRLHKKVGNTTKLSRGVMLVKLILPMFKNASHVFRCLVDCWYMKAPFVLPLLALGVNVIGQARIDTVLFDFPPLCKNSKKKRGRPPKYGNKWTPDRINKLSIKRARIHVQGGIKEIKFRTTQCLARFLKGRPVIAVWCQYPEQKGWSLILSTDLSLTPERIIKLYARRWKTEPMFNEIKHAYGVAEAWQQTSRALHRWVSMLCTAYSLTRMLSLIAAQERNKCFVPQVPWRAHSDITAGLVRLGILMFFRRFSFSVLWNPKCKKLVVPKNKLSWKDTG